MIRAFLFGVVVSWMLAHTIGAWRNRDGYGPLAEGCHFRAVDPNPIIAGSTLQLKPLKRSKNVLCFHYATEAYRW